jgi:hypothetical protein
VLEGADDHPRDVVALLGEPEERDSHSFYWDIGLERDSFFQVDDELLTVTFKGDLVSKVDIAQS